MMCLCCGQKISYWRIKYDVDIFLVFVAILCRSHHKTDLWRIHAELVFDGSEQQPSQEAGYQNSTVHPAVLFMFWTIIRADIQHFLTVHLQVRVISLSDCKIKYNQFKKSANLMQRALTQCPAHDN